MRSSLALRSRIHGSRGDPGGSSTTHAMQTIAVGELGSQRQRKIPTFFF